ncbi:MAG: hypothetical protein IT361_07715 [Gemmatimonadaceae bacterium]|nr:hypothetical protein [Gemmatimonadaceae bacterium]
MALMIAPTRSCSVAALVLLAACGTSTGGTEPPTPQAPADAANILTVSTRKATYPWNEVSFAGDGIVATIANLSTRDYFSRIGDFFGGSGDQDPVYIAGGTDAAVERLAADGSWTVLPTGILIEGSKVVGLRSGKTYELRGHLEEPRVVGTMRLRLRYFTTPNTAGVTPLVDYSPPFVVR